MKIGIPSLLGIVIACSVASYRGFSFTQPNASYWSDGFFVSGILFTGFGALMLIATVGLFDMISYGFHSLLHRFTNKAFYDFKIDREARRGKPQFHILLIGLVFFMLSLACLALYYRS